MQGLITLDFGNTNPHAGLFQKLQGQWNLMRVVPLNEIFSHLDELSMNAHNSSMVLCDVKPREDEIKKFQESGFLVTRVKDYWKGNRFAGMPVKYASTLGEDRLIEAFYCYKKFKNPVLIIDSGTFVTMDVITEDGFLGGYIFPGMHVYFETFARGELLKNISPELSYDHLLPNDSSKAMAESYLAFVSLAQKVIKENNIQKIILTGGQSDQWEIFFHKEKTLNMVEKVPHLIHWSLLFWMTTQIEPI